jgi:hypothetical protein
MKSSGLVEFRIRHSNGYVTTDWFENDGRYWSLRVSDGVMLGGAVYRIYKRGGDVFFVTDPESYDFMLSSEMFSHCSRFRRRLFVVHNLADLKPVVSGNQMSAASGV